jgi:hypothetical protein
VQPAEAVIVAGICSSQPEPLHLIDLAVRLSCPMRLTAVNQHGALHTWICWN